jgi:chemotaxis protein methyltransferase CheR
MMKPGNDGVGGHMSIDGDRARESLAIAAAFDRVPRNITESEFRRFQELIYRESGIWLSQAKTALLVGRLAKRLRYHRLQSFKDYYCLVAESPEERVQMLDAISTNETHFFREPRHFELLDTVIFPRWAEDAAHGRRPRRIRVWSAGCSTGQEPYSLAMALRSYFPADTGWEIEIIATDLSTRTLEIAQQGIWPIGTAQEVPEAYLKKFMLKGIMEDAGKMKAGAEIRSLVWFFRLNLNDATYPFQGIFDLIFCRNVLIYFDLQSRSRIIRHLLEYLSPQGYLFVGHAESLHAMSGTLRSVVPTVYTLTPKAGEEGNASI